MELAKKYWSSNISDTKLEFQTQRKGYGNWTHKLTKNNNNNNYKSSLIKNCEAD